jgi:hypothetical protein
MNVERALLHFQHGYPEDNDVQANQGFGQSLAVA